MSTYTPGIPTPQQLLSVSQGLMQTNFTQLNAQFGIDHTPLDNGGSNGNGFHKQVTMPTTQTPSSQTDPQSVWYTKKSTSPIFTQYSLPFFMNQAGSLAFLPDLQGGATTYGNTVGFKWGQLIFNFGRDEIRNGQQSKTTPWAINYTMVYCLQVSKDGNGIGASANSLGISGTASNTEGVFTAQATVSSGNYPYYFLAIGY